MIRSGLLMTATHLVYPIGYVCEQFWHLKFPIFCNGKAKGGGVAVISKLHLILTKFYSHYL